MKSNPLKIPTPSAEIFTRLVLEVFHFNGRLIAKGDQLTKDLGLSSALWQVLGAIGQKPLTVAQIARRMGLTRQSVRRTVYLLSEKNYVTFKENPDHQRAKLVCLTRLGEDVLVKTREIQTCWANQVTHGLNQAELKHALDMIQILGKRL